jgi:PPK2 family polyphosphate:nucleotide phosphotransferase
VVATVKLDTESMKVKPGRAAGIAERDASYRLGLTGKVEAQALHDEILGRLQTLQNRLWAEQRRGLLLVLQGMDASGKDGTIRAVFSGINPQGCRVTSFKAPAGKEAAHDYLWRVHEVCPARGEIGIFNRSHYEDVLAVRVRKLAPESVWRLRYRHIREFERMLVHEGTTILKVFLHISFDEQRERLQARVDNPEKRWKFRMGDLDDRAHWDAYRKAYEEAITETSTSWAPWYVVPADLKWVRNAAVAQVLVDVLETMDPRIPEPEEGIQDVEVT